MTTSNSLGMLLQGWGPLCLDSCQQDSQAGFASALKLPIPHPESPLSSKLGLLSLTLLLLAAGTGDDGEEFFENTAAPTGLGAFSKTASGALPSRTRPGTHSAGMFCTSGTCIPGS